MQWTTEKPTQSGYYWIYTIPDWEDKPVVMIVKVVIINNNVSFGDAMEALKQSINEKLEA